MENKVLDYIKLHQPITLDALINYFKYLIDTEDFKKLIWNLVNKNKIHITNQETLEVIICD